MPPLAVAARPGSAYSSLVFAAEAASMLLPDAHVVYELLVFEDQNDCWRLQQGSFLVWSSVVGLVLPRTFGLMNVFIVVVILRTQMPHIATLLL